MARILVTGAAGFIGRALCPVLAARGHVVYAGLRSGAAAAPIAGAVPRRLGELAPGREWADALRGVDIVIHLAERAHRRPAASVLAGQPAAAAALAASAARSSARRFVYVSSIKAMAETTQPGRPLRAGDAPAPGDAYGRAKLATERALSEVAAETGLELVILRPPLVYGPGVGGNFRALMRLAGSFLPLPFAAVDNRRSLIALDNLVDLAAEATVHPEAAGRVLLLADGPAFSTAALIRILAAAQDRSAHLFPLPGAVFAALRAPPGLGPAVARLTLSLEVDDSASRAVLGWVPPVAAAEALTAAAQALSPR